MSNNREKGAQWKELLQSALTDLKQLLHEDGVVSSYEIHSSGLVQSLLAMLSTTVWDQGINPTKRSKLQKQRIRIFRNIFKVSAVLCAEMLVNFNRFDLSPCICVTE